VLWIVRAIVELAGAGTLVSGHPLGVFEGATITFGATGVTAYLDNGDH